MDNCQVGVFGALCRDDLATRAQAVALNRVLVEQFMAAQAAPPSLDIEASHPMRETFLATTRALAPSLYPG